LQLLVRNLHRLQIGTLDAYFAQLGGSFSLELGLPPGWRIAEPMIDDALRQQAIELLLAHHERKEILRLVHLMAKGEARRSVSQSLKDTVRDLYDLYMETDSSAWQKIPTSRRLTDQTLADSIQVLEQAELPDKKSLISARADDVQRARQADWEAFIAKGIAGKVLQGEVTFNRVTIPDQLIPLYQSLLRHARAVLVDQLDLQTRATYELLDRFHSIYCQLKHRGGGLRFEDITRALAASPALGRVESQHYRMDTHLAHLLLDEFQDTSLLQWQVVDPLARHVTQPTERPGEAPGPGGRSLFCVGDVKQAIYGWRGGRAEIFDALTAQFPSLEQSELLMSYRSAPPVIDTVNLVFENMTRHPNLDHYAEPVRAWSESFPHHETARRKLPGFAELCSSPDPDKGESVNERLYGYAAERVRELVLEAPEHSVGVLVRKNDEVSRMIYLLRASGVAASEEGGNPLTDSPAVQLLLSMLTLIDHPGDSVAAFHLANSPMAAVTGVVDHNDATVILTATQRWRRRLLDEGYGPALLRWAGELGSVCDQRDRERLRQLVQLAYRYQPLATLRTTDFVEFLSTQKAADPTAAEVRVMTIHQAKGLQFDAVFLPSLTFGLAGRANTHVFGQPSPTDPIDRICIHRNATIQQLLPPDWRALFDNARSHSIREALCLLYVAMTRPVHALYMVIPPSRGGEHKVPKQPSGLLRAALTDGQCVAAEQTLYQTGDPRWYRKTKKVAEIEDTERPREAHGQSDRSMTETGVPMISLAPPIGPSSREHVSPSKLEGGGRVEVAHLLDFRSAERRLRGTLIHAFFELIEWVEDGVPDEDMLRRAAARLRRQPSAEFLSASINEFHAMVDQPVTSDTLSRSFYRPTSRLETARVSAPLEPGATEFRVERERPFTVRDGTQWLTGTIDRLVLFLLDGNPIAADVIDFKTDAVGPRDDQTIRDRVEHYRPQVESYRRAVSLIFNLPITHIAGHLLFVGADRLERVTPDRSDSAETS